MARAAPRVREGARRCAEDRRSEQGDGPEARRASSGRNRLVPRYAAPRAVPAGSEARVPGAATAAPGSSRRRSAAPTGGSRRDVASRAATSAARAEVQLGWPAPGPERGRYATPPSTDPDPADRPRPGHPTAARDRRGRGSSPRTRIRPATGRRRPDRAPVATTAAPPGAAAVGGGPADAPATSAVAAGAAASEPGVHRSASPRTRSSSPAGGPWRRHSRRAGPAAACSWCPSAARPSTSWCCMPRRCASRSSRSRAARSPSLTGFDGHQGVALVVEPRRWATLDDVMARARERGEAPFVLVLDSLEDPQNVGTLLRSAEACGVHGVLFPVRRSAPIGPAAIKASAGAVEHLLMVPHGRPGGRPGRPARPRAARGRCGRVGCRSRSVTRTCGGRSRWSWAARGGASRAHPAAHRSVRAHPDARQGRFPQCRRGRFRAAVRGRRAATRRRALGAARRCPAARFVDEAVSARPTLAAAVEQPAAEDGAACRCSRAAEDARPRACCPDEPV